MVEATAQNKRPLNGRKISDILRELPEQFSTPTVTIGELKSSLTSRVYGVLFLVLAFPNIVPIPLPGLSTALGVPLVLLTFQLMLGKKTPWLPKFIARRAIKRDVLLGVCTRIIPHLEKLEVIIKPRLKFLAQPPADRVIAFVCLLLALTMVLPIPFGNALPGLSICLFAIALLQSDGLFVVFAVLTSLVGVTVVSAFLGAMILSVSKFFGG